MALPSRWLPGGATGQVAMLDGASVNGAIAIPDLLIQRGLLPLKCPTRVEKLDL